MNTVQDKLEQFKADIASDKLTYPQIRERLETLIEHEYSKEGGPDVDLVIACEDLLWRLGTDNAPFVTREDQYKEAIKSRIEASQRTRQIKKPVLRFVAALVVVFFFLAGRKCSCIGNGLNKPIRRTNNSILCRGSRLIRN